MNIDIKALEINVNFHALQPQFLDLELHYIIAEDEQTFRFVNWNDTPNNTEKKYYCFLKEKELIIPNENIVLQESYLVTEQPIYPLITDCKDFLLAIEEVKNRGVAKGIRRFTTQELDTITIDLQKEFSEVESHIVVSPELKHRIFVIADVEISVAPTMVYFRRKAPFSESHYQGAKEE